MEDVHGLKMTSESIRRTIFRIGMFSESFHPVQNGVTTSVLTLIAGLRSEGHRVCTFAPAHVRQPESESNVLRFPSFVSAFNKDYPLAFPFYPRLALETHFDRLRLDVIHTHTPFVMGLTGAKLAMTREVPLISSFHTLYSQYTHYVPFLSDSVTQSLLEHYLPWYYNRCAEIICPSQMAARTLRAYGIERPINIIPTGVPIPPADLLSEENSRCARDRIGVNADTPLLVYAGRLAKEKNIDWLMEVFGLIRASVPNAVLALAGDGSYRDELKLLAAAFGTQVLFVGSTPRRELDMLLAACDVFVFPSPTETQGLVIGEARAAGAPCVVVDMGGAPETVAEGEDGFRIPEGDKAAFAARVIQLLTDKSMAKTMRANARKNAQRYAPDKMVKSVLDIYLRAGSSDATLPISQEDFPPELSEDLDWETLGQAVVEKDSVLD